MLRKKSHTCTADRAPQPHRGEQATLQTPERLVGLGFRYWMAGCKSGDISCWERAWELYSGELGPSNAKVVIGELSTWVRTVGSNTRRDIEVASPACAMLCRDECLAVSMIAASQHRTCPAMRACAFALIENSMIQKVVDQSDQFATMLHAVDQRLSPASIVSLKLAEMSPANGYYQ